MNSFGAWHPQFLIMSSCAISMFPPSTGSCRFPGGSSHVLRRRQPTSSKPVKSKCNGIRSVTQRLAKEENDQWKGEGERRKSGWKDYIEESKELIKSDGGPPRWFSPLHGGSRLSDSPLLLFLPGIDGVGLGLILHHQNLGKIFDVWCLHIPVKDRTPFAVALNIAELMKMVERTVRSENSRSHQEIPIYIIGDSLGACLALAIAARNPDIDLVLILANPATSYSRSQLQFLPPLLEAMPAQVLSSGVPYFLSLMADDASRTVLDYMVKGFSMQNTVRELLEDLSIFPSSLPVLAEILPRETLMWKLQMLKSTSSYANSRFHSIKAQILILSSGKDQLLPSQHEGERLYRLLPKCELRKFDDSGHFLFLDGSIDLLTIIKSTNFYRRGKYHDLVSDFIPPSPVEIKSVSEKFRLFNTLTSAVTLSTLEDGRIVRGLNGIPAEGPVLLVGYHMLLASDVIPLLTGILLSEERNILVRAMAHPAIFERLRNGKLPELSSYDWMRLVGAVPVSANNLYKLLSSNAHVLLYPGGAREVLHRKGEEYKLFWPEQAEFVRMAARFGAKIVPFGTVGEDDFGQVVIDYDDLIKIPYLRSEIESLTKEARMLRGDADGEVANQQVHLPGIVPKFPGRFYYYFGKPIETQGREKELIMRDKEEAHKVYVEVKREVERCIGYLKEKRESDPFRYLTHRLLYQAMHGFTHHVPTFEI